MICETSNESVLHKKAKKIVAGLRSIWVTEHIAKCEHNIVCRPILKGMLTITNAVIEPHLTEYDYIPDVQIETVEMGTINIEICVTHAVDTEKIVKIEKSGIPTLEIDISKCGRYNKERLITEIATNEKIRKWIVPLSYTDKWIQKCITEWYTAVDTIIKKNTSVELGEFTYKLSTVKGAETYVIPSEPLFYVYDAKRNDRKGYIDILEQSKDDTLRGLNHAVFIVQLTDIPFEPLLSWAETAYLLDLRDTFADYIQRKGSIYNSEGTVNLKVLQDIVLKRGVVHKYRYSVSANHQFINSLHARTIYYNKVDDEYWVSNCPLDICSFDYNKTQAGNTLLSCANPFTDCRKCSCCFYLSYTSETQKVEVRCLANKNAIIPLVKQSFVISAAELGCVGCNPRGLSIFGT